MIGGLVVLAVLFVFNSMYRHNNNYTYAPATTPAPTTTPPSTTGSAVPTAPAGQAQMNRVTPATRKEVFLVPGERTAVVSSANR
jgi:hypothetical protein